MDQKYLNQALDLLTSQDLTCTIIGPETQYTSKARGIAPLLTCYKEQLAPPNCCAADKVVGRAAAFMYVLLKVDALYAQILSKPALRVLEEAGIHTEYGQIVDAIINRTGTGFCPMESAVLDIDDPLEALAAVEKKLEQLRQ